jgi:uncharacterized protein
MTEWQQRVIAEKAELDDRLEKLDEFINTSPRHEALHPAEQQRLRSQRYFMKGYSDALDHRIDHFQEH